MSKTIEISDEFYESIKDQLCADNATEITAWADFVGSKVFIRTVTYHLIGRVKAVNGNLIELSDASVVFSSGNLQAALKTGRLTESEPVGKMWVNSQATTDIFPWTHELPKVAK